jgi:hypothetical protein
MSNYETPDPFARSRQPRVRPALRRLAEGCARAGRVVLLGLTFLIEFVFAAALFALKVFFAFLGGVGATIIRQLATDSPVAAQAIPPSYDDQALGLGEVACQQQCGIAPFPLREGRTAG